MFDLGWQEILLIAIISIVVIGPKDLPNVIRSVAQWVRKARSLASEFQDSLQEMAREAELDDVRKQIQAASQGDVGKILGDHIDPSGSMRADIESIGKAVGDTETDLKAIGGAAADPMGGADPTGGPAAAALPEPVQITEPVAPRIPAAVSTEEPAAEPAKPKRVRKKKAEEAPAPEAVQPAETVAEAEPAKPKRTRRKKADDAPPAEG